MVVRVNISRSVLKALSYNEQKLSAGKAECLYAHNYLQEGSATTYDQKLYGLEHRNVLNDRAFTNTLHCSLNFDPSENLSKEQLEQIAVKYMEKMGFSEQPYLVYQHLDAGHPHLHIVSTLIRDDGSRIPTHNIGKNVSEKARKEIEQAFHLKRAEEKKRAVQQESELRHATKLEYGKVETKQSITRVLQSVVDAYRFTSLEQFNAVLRQFNLVADRGKEKSRIYQNSGLVYRMLDEGGKKIGIPIKASSLEGKPTLSNLERLFVLNVLRKEPYKEKVKCSIEDVLSTKPASLLEFMQKLKEKNTYTLLDKKGQGGGLTFVDNAYKCVFQNSELGKDYTTASIQSRLIVNKNYSKENTHSPSLTHSLKPAQEQEYDTRIQQQVVKKDKLLDILFSPKKKEEENLSSPLLQKREKKKQNLHL